MSELYFTSGFRGFPPYTLSQHPDNKETGYSNVLVNIHLVSMKKLSGTGVQLSSLHRPSKVIKEVANIQKEFWNTSRTVFFT